MLQPCYSHMTSKHWARPRLADASDVSTYGVASSQILFLVCRLMDALDLGLCLCALEELLLTWDFGSAQMP